MKANFNHQSLLAKLLAKENITVHSGNYHTAFFDVKNRLLGLPTWNIGNKQVSDLLVGHEVSHALHTPLTGLDDFRKCLPTCPFDVFNIVEDIRIGRLIQDQYPGLISSFIGGYRYFIENDFFKIKDKDLSKMPFIDRLNLRGKIGMLMDIPLSVIEETIYRKCLKAETIGQVIDICNEIYTMEKDNLSKEKQSSEDEMKLPDFDDPDKDVLISNPPTGSPKEHSDNDTNEGSEFDQDGSEDEANQSEMPSDDTSNQISEDSNGGNSGSGDVDERLKSKTLSDLDKELNKIQADATLEKHIVTPMKDDMMRQVTPVDKVMESRIGHRNYSNFSRPEVSEDWVKFKASTKKSVGILVKEFERRKAAFQYSRARQNTTGSIDVNRLHSYKYEDQIFKSVMQLADAKSHGMMFFIDYSSSMYREIPNVINHTLNLCFFCKAVGIPFEVYGFTNCYTKGDESEYSKLNSNQISFRYTGVFELLNSSMKKDKYELACRQLRAQAFLLDDSLSQHDAGVFSSYEMMCGTPLYETIIIAHELVNQFKMKNKIQKMNVIFLTDGDGASLGFGNNQEIEKYVKKGTQYSDKYIMKLNGRTVHFSRSPQVCYGALIKNLKITCGATVIGFFITSSKNGMQNSAINSLRYNKGINNISGWTEAAEKVKKLMVKYKKDKCLLIEDGFNFDQYITFNAHSDFNIEDEDEDFDPDFDMNGKFSSTAAQNKLAKAFTKHTSDKRTSRIVMNKFAELVS
jgi:hypothetical protein